MKKLLFFTLCLICLSCSQKLKIEESFTFDLGMCSGPHFIVVNDNVTGELIAYTKYSNSPITEIEIPEDKISDLYTLNFIRQAGFYEPGEVSVMTYKDVKAARVHIIERDSIEYGYIALDYFPKESIDSFLNSKNHYYQKDAHVELSYDNMHQGNADLVFLKLKGEDNARYHLIDDIAGFSKDSIDVKNLPMVQDYLEITLDEDINRAYHRIGGRIENEKNMRSTIYDTYKTDFIDTKSLMFPIIDEDIEYYSWGYLSNGSSRMSYLTKGIEQDLKIEKVQFDIINNKLSDFQLINSNADMAMFTFRLEKSDWYIIDDVTNGVNCRKPEFPQEVIDIFPELEKDGKLTTSKFVYLEDENKLNYQELALPHLRVDNMYSFGTINFVRNPLNLFKAYTFSHD